MDAFGSSMLLILQGEFKVEEDKKHRAKYQALGDSEMKLKFFAARQIACRLLGSRNYLCQKVIGYFARIVLLHNINFLHLNQCVKMNSILRYVTICCPMVLQCWLPMEDCMCSKVIPCSLWHGLRFWVYMHPKVLILRHSWYIIHIH